MAVIFVVLAVLVVVAIALVAVGGVVGSLSAQPALRTYSLDEAVDFVADRLPERTSAVLSYADVRAIIGWHLDFLEQKGVARASTDPTPSDGVEASGVPGPAQVVDEDDALAWVLGRIAESEDGLPDAGVDFDDTEVVAVLDGNEAYLVAIGAVGGEVAEPLDPTA